MRSIEEVKKRIQKISDKNVFEYVTQMKPEFDKALNDENFTNLFVRTAITGIRQNRDLQACTVQSLLGSLMQAAQLKLLPGVLGQAWLVPYKIKQPDGSYRKECQFQIGYQGYKDLFYRDSHSSHIEMRTVYENDEFYYEYGTTPYIKHVPAMYDRGEPYCYYCIATLVNGAKLFLVMSDNELEEIRVRYVKMSQYSPWKTEPEQMKMKTVLKRLSKTLPLSIEVQRQLSQDETVKYYNPESPPQSITDQPDVMDWKSIEIEQEEVKTKEK